MTRTKGSADQPLEIATIAGEEMLPWLRDIEGFEGLLMLTNEAEATTLVLAFWENREIAERHRVARLQLRDRVTAAVDVRVEESTDYEVSFADLGAWLSRPSDR